MTADAALFEAPTSHAWLSEDECYRYRLTRGWNPTLGLLTFVMLNPSTADATKNDPTILRCIGFARALGFGGIEVVNLYAWRATHPADLWRVNDPVGPENDRALAEAFSTAAMMNRPVIAAWGGNARPDRVADVLGLPHADQLHALGVTLAGAPKHPLARGHHRIPDDATPAPWTTWKDPNQ